MAGKSAAAAPAAKTSDVVHEFVLYRRAGDDRVPLMSDNELGVVEHAKASTIAHALRDGQPRPDLFIVDRKCTYPLRNGKRQAEGSTCEEREI